MPFDSSSEDEERTLMPGHCDVDMACQSLGGSEQARGVHPSGHIEDFQRKDRAPVAIPSPIGPLLGGA